MPQINVKPEGTKDTFTVFGGCREFMDATEPQVILYGSTGSGKTTTLCYRLLMRMIMYPGAKALLTRNSYVALVKSGVETLERVAREMGYKIGKKDSGEGTIYRLGESKPTEYRFPYAKRLGKRNGKDHLYEGESRILIASLSNAKDELGAEYDYIYLNQPELSSEDDWQFLATRCNGRRGHVPYPQLMGDPNPEHEQHWIKLGGYELNEDGSKFGSGDRWRLIKSTYKDNPMIWDHKLNCFTKEGELMISRLRESLNPVMAKRLIEGEWCNYEGLAFGDVWNRAKHVIDTEQLEEYRIDDTWERYWAIDFGFDDPFVWAQFVKHPSRELYIRTKLIYMSQKTVLEQAHAIKMATIAEPLPRLVVADRNPQEIMLLSQALGINILSARKGPGTRVAKVDMVYDMLKKDQLKFYSDALMEADTRLIAKKLPIGFENEVMNLRWKADSINEELIDGDDHEFDALSYLFLQLKAENRVVPFIWV